MPLTSEYELSPREHLIMQAEVEEARLAREHAIAVKSLELNLARENHTADIKLQELNSKWASWLKLPKTLILLPVYLILAVAYVCSMFTKKEMPRKFWELLD